MPALLRVCTMVSDIPLQYGTVMWASLATAVLVERAGGSGGASVDVVPWSG